MDWFGKIGINWYVVVILSKRIGVFQIIIYIYIFFFLGCIGFYSYCLLYM